eukprot:SAG11_NODE_5577_length_1519_cov_1.442958_1_plen_81_part_10
MVYPELRRLGELVRPTPFAPHAPAPTAHRPPTARSVTGNLARMLLAAHKLTGNRTYLDEGLAWADTFCEEQRNVTSAAGSP